MFTVPYTSHTITELISLYLWAALPEQPVWTVCPVESSWVLESSTYTIQETT